MQSKRITMCIILHTGTQNRTSYLSGFLVCAYRFENSHWAFISSFGDWCENAFPISVFVRTKKKGGNMNYINRSIEGMMKA